MKPVSLTRKGLAMAGTAFLLASLPTSGQAAEIIELTQTGCQFLEPEGVDHHYKTASKSDCETINAQTADERLAKSQVMTLKPGDYVFRVTNKNVPYELGFWFRDKDYDWRNPLHKLSKTSVSGGGLVTGKSNDYKVTLKPGEYVFSCPLNTTPDYRVIVPES